MFGLFNKTAASSVDDVIFAAHLMSREFPFNSRYFCINVFVGDWWATTLNSSESKILSNL